MFDNTIYNGALEKEFFYFCLKRQFSLITYFISYFFQSVLYFFKIIPKKKYFEKRWSFLADVKDIDGKLNHFWKSSKKKFPPFILDEKVIWISEYPKILLTNLAKQYQVELITNEYNLSTKDFPSFKDVNQLYEKITHGENTQIYDDNRSNFKKIKDADFIIVYNRKTFDSRKKYWTHRILHTTYTSSMLLMMGLCLGVISMYFGASYYRTPMFISYFSVEYLPFLNIFPVVFFMFLLYLIFNRVWVSFLLTAVITMALTWINYFKLLIRNDPFYAIDVTLLFESMDMADKFDIQLDWKVISVMIACVIGTAIAYFFVKGTIRSLRLRLFAIALLGIVGVYSFNNIYMDDQVYSATENNDLINKWSSTQEYISKSFLYPFIYSIKSNIDRPPEGYDAEVAKEKLDGYEYSDIADDEKVHVISIMLESYNDFSKFEEIEFDKGVYEYWHQLENESYSGELVTNIFVGGTVDTERSFLTGYTSLLNFRNHTNSYAHYFREQDYTVEGSHPSYEWFYNRKNINEYLGFENYYFLENYYGELTNGEIAKDALLFPEILKMYETNKETGKPYFSFNVTYQNHGPYSTESTSDVQYVKNNDYTEEEYNILNNYFAGINNTNQELKTFMEAIKDEDEPIVVILFGDHNPWLGDNNSVYERLNIDLDLGTEEGFYNYYNTPYIISGNDKAKEILGNDLDGEGPTIGPYFLMNEFFDLAGYGGNEFMKFSNKLKADVDVVHTTDRYKESDVLTTELSSESKQKLNEFLQVQYYWMKNFK